jgi:hypothetical protein
MWKRFLHLLLIGLLVAGNTGFLSLCLPAGLDCDGSLPAEPAEEESESADEIELDKFHSGVAWIPAKTTVISHQWQWNGRRFGDAQLAECSHGVSGVRGPPLG